MSALRLLPLLLLLLLAACRAPLSGKITSEAGHSGDEHPVLDYRVYLPPGYENEPGRRYPLLVWFHGGGENENGWGREGKIGEIVHDRTVRGELQPFIVLSPSAGPFTPLWFGYEKRFFNETLPQVQQQYRTNGKVLAFGHSLGGLSALIALLRNPGVFDAACIASPFVFDTSAWESKERRAWFEKTFGEAGFPARYRRNQRKYFDAEAKFKQWDPFALIRAGEARRLPPLLLTCGDKDPLGLWPHAVHLHERLDEYGARHDWLPQNGHGHGTVEDPRLTDWLNAKAGGR